jgi:predicted transcriptional regulator
MKYRSRSDIIGLLLNAANGGGVTKMKLMYKAYLTFNQLKEYLTFVAENGLIEYEEGMRTYRTTENLCHHHLISPHPYSHCGMQV